MLKNIEDLIFYEIYPKSFCDLNGDGIGDLQGIVSKIGYLKELGINAVWLTPFYRSPNVDNGYDISDYRDVSPDLGTFAQAEELIAKFHESGIAVIIDLVANHTSTAHKWFAESRKSRDNPYRDYYIWRKKPPNDWQSVFGGGSAWEYDEQTGEYYLHSFAVEQADLNWENPKVREEMRSVVDFWISRGVDGFRCDVLDMISKDWEKGENGNGPRLHGYIRELFGRESVQGIFTVGECWSANAENAKLFCGKERRELTTVFAFSHLCVEEGRFRSGKPTLKELCRRISDWQLETQKQGIPAALFLENHDQPRSVSRFADDGAYRFESATMLGGLVLLHRGIPFLFQGEEIGLTNSRLDRIEDFNDVESLNYYRDNPDGVDEEERLAWINFAGRDNARYMLPWDDEPRKSWQAAYSRQREVNVEADLRAEKSVYEFYRKLIALRKRKPCLTKGRYSLVVLEDTHYIFRREYGKECVTVVCNFGKEIPFAGLTAGEVLLNNYDCLEDRLKPYQLLVYKTEK